MSSTLQSEFSLVSKQGALAPEQMQLLRAVRETGSISAAAKKLGVSYKTAWDRIERLNQLSPVPLVERAAGGSRGGGTRVTEQGQQLIAGYSLLEQQHKGFIEKLGEKLHSLEDISTYVGDAETQKQRPNLLTGTVAKLQRQGASFEIQLRLGPELLLVAVLPAAELDAALPLPEGSPLVASIPPSTIVLATGQGYSTSARNQWPGTVVSVAQTDMSALVTLQLPGELQLLVQVTPSSVRDLALRAGTRVTALCKASGIKLSRPAN